MKKAGFSFKKGLFLIYAIIVALVAISFTSCVKPDDPEPDPVTKYTVKTVVKEGLGTISPAGETKVNSGVPITITTSPNPGFRDDTITINGVEELLVDHKYVLRDVSDEDYYTVEVKFKTDYAWILEQGVWNQDSVSTTFGRDITTLYTIKSVDWFGEMTKQFLTYGNDGIKDITNGMMEQYTKGALSGYVGWRLDQDKTPMILHIGVTRMFPNGDSWIVEKLDKNSLVIVKHDIQYLEDGVLIHSNGTMREYYSK